MKIEDLSVEEYKRIHENSLKTSVRWAWNGLCIYGTLLYIEHLIKWAEHPERNYLNPKHHRRMKKTNLRQYRQDMSVYAFGIVSSIAFFIFMYYAINWHPSGVTHDGTIIP